MSDYATLVEWCAEAGTRQLLVIENGRTLVEECWGADASTTTDIASMQKCLSVIVLGQLVREGRMALDAPVSDYLGAGWTRATPEQERAITVRHVVTMRSGLDDSLAYDATPGGEWYYCNNAYHQVRHAMEVVTGSESEPLFAERLWRPLGLKDTSWQPRPEMKDPHGRVLSGVHTTAQDMARFGQAVLDRDAVLGCTSQFLEEMLTGTDSNPSYGLLWWNYGGDRAVVPGYRRGQTVDPKNVFGGIRLERRIAPSAPRDCVGASGAGDQRLYLVPSRRLVVVRLGRAAGDMHAAGGPFDEAFWSRMPDDVRRTE